jgi:hypothetical protein
VASLVAVESSTGRADRLDVAALQPRALAVEVLKPEMSGHPLTFASASPDTESMASNAAATDDSESIPAASTDTGSDSGRGTEVSLDDLCNALFTSAHDNDLPIPFFANLIWQESRLRDDAVSSKGALGIAQFMPEVAAETGLDDPFDPLQAIPASARLLRDLRLQFGNLGFVAAAYNAGAHRVAEWLEHRRSLPRETRGYVVQVTGLSVDAWRTMAVDNDALSFVRHLPCRSLPAFASLEQEHLEQTQLQQARLDRAEIAQAAAAAATAAHSTHHRVADRKLARAHIRNDAVRVARNRRTGRREAEHSRAHEKRRAV